jgi:transposase-like protein
VGQVLHGSATTTHAVRAAIQRSKASLQAMSERYGINPKTVAKWRRRTDLEDRPMGPKVPRSTVLSTEEETLIVGFRRHTLLPLDDCLYALQATIPHLTRSSLHRLFKRHGISRLPNIEDPRHVASSGPIRSGTSTSTWRRCRRKKGSCICSSPSTGSASSPSRSSTNRPHAELQRISCGGLWNECPTVFTRCSPITAFSSRRPRAAGRSKRFNSCWPTGDPSEPTPLT